MVAEGRVVPGILCNTDLFNGSVVSSEEGDAVLLRDCHYNGGERNTLPRSGGLSTYGSTAINFQRLVTETVHISAFL